MTKTPASLPPLPRSFRLLPTVEKEVVELQPPVHPLLIMEEVF